MKDTAPSTWTRATLAKPAGVGAESLRFNEQQGLIETPARNTVRDLAEARLGYLIAEVSGGRNIKPKGEPCHE